MVAVEKIPLEDAIRMSRELGISIAKSFNPSIVVGILRDGFLPAVEISDILRVPPLFLGIKRRIKITSVYILKL